MNTIIFSPGVEVDGEFIFRKENDISKVSLEIQKKETAQMTYKLAITYLGQTAEGRDSWSVEINDKIPDYSHRELKYFSSRRFSIQPSGSGWEVTMPKDMKLGIY